MFTVYFYRVNYNKLSKHSYTYETIHSNVAAKNTQKNVLWWHKFSFAILYPLLMLTDNKTACKKAKLYLSYQIRSLKISAIAKTQTSLISYSGLCLLTEHLSPFSFRFQDPITIILDFQLDLTCLSLLLGHIQYWLL